MTIPHSTFTSRLPKLDLHAHLTGSISRRTLHNIWAAKKLSNPDLPLQDPLIAIPHGHGTINIATFFPIFDKYIYHLIDSLNAVYQSTLAVLHDFAEDGVVYLELRTTPRPVGSSSKQEYVETVLDAMRAFMLSQDKLHAQLILSIDRRNTLDEAMHVVDLALKYAEHSSPCRVVGLDLCGNPTVNPISHLAPAFRKAHAHNLPITLHFAEVSTTSSREELSELLDWHPSRLGHVIHVDPATRDVLIQRKLALELCLSCNVQAGMIEGGYAGHHFKDWLSEKTCTIVLCTDDVGIFESSLSDEYRLAGQHYGLDENDLLRLSQGAIEAIFAGDEEKERLRLLMDEFGKENCGWT